MKGLGTDHMISGPIRGLKNVSNGTTTHKQQQEQHTDGHHNSKTESTQKAYFLKKINKARVTPFYIDFIFANFEAMHFHALALTLAFNLELCLGQSTTHHCFGSHSLKAVELDL